MSHTRYESLMAELRTIRAYLLSMKEIKEHIALMIYDMANVRAIRYDLEPSHTSEAAKEWRRLGLIEDKAVFERELDMTMLAYAPVRNKVIQALSEQDDFIREVLLDRFGLDLNDGEFTVKGDIKTYDVLGEKYGYTPQGLYSKIKREVR